MKNQALSFRFTKVGKICAIVFVFTSYVVDVYGGMTTGSTRNTKANEVKRDTTQEKVYIHYDRDNYVLGDTVWFKAYLFTTAGRSKSKNFYFELFDDRGKLLKRVTAPILESTASGSLILPDDNRMTSLFCRAYTAAMLNGDITLIYNKQLSVINLKHETQANASNTVNIRFLPEGGELINNVPSVVAFKVTDANGFPVNGSGNITSNDTLISRFSTIHDGMGVLTMITKAGQVYKAIWTDQFGTEHTTLLPAQKSKGIVLHINDVPNGKKFFVFRSRQADEDDKPPCSRPYVITTWCIKLKSTFQNMKVQTR